MGFKRLAATILVITFILGISSGSAFASEKTDVGAAVYRHFDNLDNDKLETALAMCDSQVSILEEFPPHEGTARRRVPMGGRRWVPTARRVGLAMGTPRWARRGPSTSAEIVRILLLPRSIRQTGARCSSLSEGWSPQANPLRSSAPAPVVSFARRRGRILPADRH